MSNIMNEGSPLELDTKFNPGATGANAIPPVSLYVSSIEYVPASAGDSFSIKNNTGKVRAGKIAGPNDAGETLTQYYEEGALVLNPQEGWYLAALSTGGTLKIYFTSIGV